MASRISLRFCQNHSCAIDLFRDAPEPTGEEVDDSEFDAPKIYERVSVLYIYRVFQKNATLFERLQKNNDCLVVSDLNGNP